MSQTQPGMKKPPRSLTEDDLEHISRLPSQEIVLVYFPDTNRFKDLNRKLRNWLITLDVNDVKVHLTWRRQEVARFALRR